MDGTYTEATTGLVQPNVRNGQPGNPITIKAINDGQAVIDGQGENYPVRLGDNWGPHGAISDWFVVEGLVARNGGLGAIRIEKGNHNVLRRVSAYNASPDDNSLVLAINWGSDNLVEDCVVAGTGRYMINVFTSNNNTVRRCFTQWACVGRPQLLRRQLAQWQQRRCLQFEQHDDRKCDRLRSFVDRHLHPGERCLGHGEQQPDPGQHVAAARARLRRQRLDIRHRPGAAHQPARPHA